LSPPQYELTAASSELEAVRLLEREQIAAVLLDIAAPDLDGVRTLRHLSLQSADTALVVLTGLNDATVAASCFRDGALDYLLQPAHPDTLDLRLQAAVQRRRALLCQTRADEVLRDELGRLTVLLRRARRNAAQISISALGSLVSMMEIRTPHLAGHSMRVAQLAASMAAELGRSTRDVEQVRAAGRLHDIGMLCVADGILSKAGSLNPEEVERVKQHVTIADQILSEMPTVDLLRSFVRSHHERWDGTGYPDGLSGDAIPWGARLIGAAEVYDALTTPRSYRTAAMPVEAIERMASLREAAIAPDAYEVLTSVVQSGRALVFIGSDDEAPVAALETADRADL
jgi:putative two-component system response regulator